MIRKTLSIFHDVAPQFCYSHITLLSKQGTQKLSFFCLKSKDLAIAFFNISAETLSSFVVGL